MEAYDRADGIWERARVPQDFEPAAAALEEGRYAMASAAAPMATSRLSGRRRASSTRGTAPPSREEEDASMGPLREVPARAADAQRVERGEDPEAREVMVGGQTPY